MCDPQTFSHRRTGCVCGHAQSYAWHRRIPWRGTAYRAPTEAEFGKPVANSLSTIIRSFKSTTTKRLRETTGNSGLVVWQRNYFEHIVRNDDALERIRIHRQQSVELGSRQRKTRTAPVRTNSMRGCVPFAGHLVGVRHAVPLHHHDLPP